MNNIANRLIATQGLKTVGAFGVPVPFVHNANYMEYLRLNNSADSTNTRITFMFLSIAYHIIFNFDLTTIASVSVLPAADPNKDQDDAIAASALDAITKSTTHCMTWFIDLIAAFQISTIDQANVKSYFAQYEGMTCNNIEILLIIRWASTMMPQVMDDPNLRVLVSNTDWILYHTSYSSTASLLERYLSALPPQMDFMYNNATRASIASALAEPWSKVTNSAIPKKIIGHANLYYKFNNIDVGTWYQGAKAESMLPLTHVNALKIIFKKLNALSKDYSQIENALSLEEALVAIPAFLREDVIPPALTQAANDNRDLRIAEKYAIFVSKERADYLANNGDPADYHPSITAADFKTIYTE